MFSRTIFVQHTAFVVAATSAFNIRSIADFKKNPEESARNTQLSHCDSPVRLQRHRGDYLSRPYDAAVYGCVADHANPCLEINIGKRRRPTTSTFVSTHRKGKEEEMTSFSVDGPFVPEDNNAQSPAVLSVRHSGRRGFSTQETLRAEKCVEALETLISDFRRTFIGLEELQLNSFDVTVSDDGYDDMYTGKVMATAAQRAIRNGEDLKQGDPSSSHTTLRLGNYSHINNKLSANIRAHMMLGYPMYQSAPDLGFELENAEQKLLKKQLLELEMYNNVDMLTKNQSIIAGRSSESVLRHELGHAIQYKVLGIANHPEHGVVDGVDNAGSEWANIYKTRKQTAEDLSKRIAWCDQHGAKKYFLQAKIGDGVSVYGGSNELELFAEAWTIYSHPEYGNSVKPLPADIHDFFVKYLPRK